MGNSPLKRLKRSLQPRLIYSPFLRLVLFNVWFQLAFGAIVCVGIFLALFLPKIWQTTPDDFLPVVKISGLDKAQNWSLKRTARKQMDAGNHPNASHSWQAAVAQDPGDREALRGFLANALSLRSADKQTFSAAVSQMSWLLRLGGTNRSDLELVAMVCDKFKWHDVALYFLSPVVANEDRGMRLSRGAEAIYVKALFHLDRMAEFQAALAAARQSGVGPELEAYPLAYTAGWGEGEAADAALRELERKAQGDPEVLWLHMRVCIQRKDAEGCVKSLRQLAALNEASARDHADYWKLLAGKGRVAEARTLASQFTSAPGSGLETVRLAEAYIRLGMIDESRELLKRFAPQFPNSAELWAVYASVLASLEDWEGMRTLALLIRTTSTTRDTLWGYSYYLEGRAELEQKRVATAEIAFQRAAECAYEIPGLGLMVGKELVGHRYPRLALKILSSVEKVLQQNPDYWKAVCEAALEVQDGPLILRAAERCYRLIPADVQAQNRYAAALMLNRTNGAEAIRVTFQLISKYPQSTVASINHSLALLMNHRPGEARELLERIRPESLNAGELPSYYLALFETYYKLQLWDLAQQVDDKIPEAALFPTQRQWLQERRKEMPQKIVGPLT